MRLEDLNALSPEAATTELLRCCGSKRWAATMAARRPFVSFDDIAAAAADVWWSLGKADWLEAFAAHPRIGKTGACGHAEPGGEGSAPEPDGGARLRPGFGVSAEARRNRASGGWRAPAPVQRRKAAADQWSAAEQSGMQEASEDVRQRLAVGNREYEARFGYIFIVCATGKPARDLLAALERRLTNAPGEELRIAAEEQRKITRIRLNKLLT